MIVGYPTPNKQKAKDILEAFCKGCEGTVVTSLPRDLHPNDAAFFGVVPATQRIWHQAVQTGRDWYYGDNAYLDPCRGEYFRFTKNRLQANGAKHSDGKRFEALGLTIDPWRENGGHVLVCPQSDEFMSVVAGVTGWTEGVVRNLKKVTKREIRVRPWDRDKAKWFATLHEDLDDCWAVVVYSSSSAISALRAGVPAIVTGADCIAAPFCADTIWAIDKIDRGWDRRPLFNIAADNQWTKTEMEDGTCWRMINA
jgi:hypothetical protein